MIALFAAFLALSVGGDEYRGFRARFIPFAGTRLEPSRVEDLRDGGYDLTSLLHKRRAEIVAILRSAREPGRFMNGNVRLFVRQRRETWAVDKSGTVLSGKRAMRLEPEAFRRLRVRILDSIPDMSWDRHELDKPPGPGRPSAGGPSGG